MSDSLNRVTIYKLKNLTNVANLKLDKYALVAESKEQKGNAPFDYRLYFYESASIHPKWFGVFEGLKFKPSMTKPKVQLPGFVLLVHCNNNFYAFSGGLGHIALRAKNEIEPRFGSILAERLLSMPELRGMVQKDTSGAVLRIDRVFRRSYNPNGEIDNLRRILSNVRGKLSKGNKLYAQIGKSIQAGNALTVNGSKSFAELFTFLAAVDKLWNTTKKSLNIPQLAHIDKKTDPLLIAELERALVKSLSKYKVDSDISLFLDTDDLGFLPDTAAEYKLVYGHTKHPAQSTYQELLEYVGSLLTAIPQESDRLNAYGAMKLRVTSDDDFTETRPLGHLLCGDIVLKSEAYFVNGNLWYQANAAFLKLIDKEIDNIECLDPKTLKLVEWDVSKHKGRGGENKFNTDCCKNGNHLLLDCRTVRIPGESGPIEFCDILAKLGSSSIALIHVKKENGAGLRELFAQGYVSASLYRDEEFRKLVHTAEMTGKADLTSDQKKKLSELAVHRTRDFKVVYAIFDNTKSNALAPNAARTSDIFRGTFTPFAKIDLLDRVQSIRAMGYGDVALVRIAPK